MKRILSAVATLLVAATPLAADILQPPGIRPGGPVDTNTVTATGSSASRALGNRFAERLNILDYAAAGTSVDQTGTVDASAALSAVVTAANAKTYYSSTHPVQPVCIYIPAGKYKISSPPPAFQGPGCVIGDGPKQTFINLTSTFSGDLFQWSEAWTVNGRFGATVSGLKIVGAPAASAQQNALMLFDRNDYVLLENVDIFDLPGRAILSGWTKNTTSPDQAYLRESRWRNLRVWRSGTASAPAVEFTSRGTTGGGSLDGTNEITVSALDIYGSVGKSLVVRNESPGIVRQIKFDSLRIEGRQSAIGESTGDLLTIGDAAASGLVAIVQLSNFELLNPGTGTAALRIDGGNATNLATTKVFGTGWIGGSGTGGGGINISNATDVHLILSDVFTGGTNVTVGAGVSNFLLNGGGKETAWSYSINPASLTGVMTPLRRVGNPVAVGPSGGTTTITGTLNVDGFSATNFSAGQITAGGVQVGSGGLTVAPGSVTSCALNPAQSRGSYTGAVGPVPALTLSAPPAGGSQAACVSTGLSFSQVVGSAALTGAGCTVGDLLTVQGGTVASGSPTILRVATIDGAGKPVTFGGGGTTSGVYATLPPDPATLTGGTCTNFPTAQVAYFVSGASVTSAGSGYVTPPAISGPTGAGVFSTMRNQIATISTALPIVASLGAVQLDGSGTALGVAGATGGPVIARGAFVDSSGVRQALTGAPYTVPQNTSLVRFTQTGTVASQTVTLPVALADGHPVQFVNYAGAVTALTFSPAVNGWMNGGALAANAGLRIRWDATSAAWYREQ